MRPHRNHRAYWAFLGHRLSGLALALFLPFHFLALGLALEAAALDRFLAWTDLGMVKLAEWGLVVLLALHLFFGLRLLVLELRPWPGGDARLGWIVPGLAAALVIGGVFLIGAF
ncbi:MAG: succinate dehydrogenase [Proteobacteria bacterium]|nr:succinate dehydrogenase [Pseudomonadota bacterium]